MSKIISNVLKVNDLLLKAKADFTRNKFDDGLDKLNEALNLMTDIREQLMDLSRTAGSVKTKIIVHGLVKFMNVMIDKTTNLYSFISYNTIFEADYDKLRRRIMPKLDAVIYVWNKSIMKYAPKV